MKCTVYTSSNPYPYYAWLREHAPVHDVPRGGYALVSRYEDIREAALDKETFSSKLVAELLAGESLRKRAVRFAVERLGPVDTLAITDAPVHLGQRKLVTRHVAAREPIAALEASTIRPEVERRVDALLARGGGDLVAELAAPLPVLVTLALLGLPTRDLPRVKRWSDLSVRLLSGVISPLAFSAGAMRMLAFQSYSASAISRAMAQRGRNALIDVLVDAVQAGQLDAREASSIVMQLLIAGSDSTANLIASAVLLLARSPELAAQLREEPSLIPAFVEETLRLETPFQGHFRVVTRETTLGGRRLPAGKRVMLLWASGNRDERVYASPERVSLERKGPAHFGFGHGAHLCLGAALARLQARIALETLLARTRDIAIVTREPRYVPSVFTRTLCALPVRLTSAAR